MPRYCVIGAGAAGLSALAQLRLAGYDATCFESTERVGGHWHTDYDALHLITSRDTTHFEDFPMPAHYPHFPRRDQVRDYIVSYAHHHELLEQITFSTPVLSVTPVPVTDGPVGSAGWRVLTSRGDEGIFDGVLVANGHLWAPNIPDVPGTFRGHQLHSGQYHNVDDLKGGRILVVGAGNSGADIAADIAQHRLEVDIVIRKGLYFQSKTYFGVPRAEVGWLTDFNPTDADLINRLLARVSLGENSAYSGLPSPEAPTLAEGPVTVNDLLPYWIHHGRIRVVPAIDRFAGPRVRFSDGTAGEYDTIVWATGFEVQFPFLEDSLLSWHDGVPVRRAGGILPEGVEKLYLVGLIGPRGPQIPVYGEQAKLICQMLALHERAGHSGLALAGYFARAQEPEHAIDVVRVKWDAEMAETGRLLDALSAVPVF